MIINELILYQNAFMILLSFEVDAEALVIFSFPLHLKVPKLQESFSISEGSYINDTTFS